MDYRCGEVEDMKAIIMAAGKGTRISRMIEDVPKCTLPINGIPLIRHTVEMLLEEGMEISICVGYRKEIVMEALEGLPVKFYCNPFYDVTNSMASLWFAREELDDEMLLLNADVFFSKEILHIVVENPSEAIMAMDTGRVEVGDYFFKTVNGCIRKYGKELPRSERDSEYVGIAKVKKNFVGAFKAQLEYLVEHHEYNNWWEYTLYCMIEKKEIRTVDVKGYFWSEIDYFDDYERILEYIGGELPMLK